MPAVAVSFLIPETISSLADPDKVSSAERKKLQAPPETGYCVICRQETMVVEKLYQGRVRCARCKSVYAHLRAASLPVKIVSKKAVKPRKKNIPPGDLPFWKQHLGKLVIGAVLLSGFLGFIFPTWVLSGTRRPPLYPVRGVLYFQGKPAAGVNVLLHPVEEKNPDFPRPRAITGPDGSFVLGSFEKDDGAPAGVYRLTAQWFQRKGRPNDDSAIFVNLLPQRYANPLGSNITVEVQPEENRWPVIQLR